MYSYISHYNFYRAYFYWCYFKYFAELVSVHLASISLFVFKQQYFTIMYLYFWRPFSVVVHELYWPWYNSCVKAQKYKVPVARHYTSVCGQYIVQPLSMMKARVYDYKNVWMSDCMHALVLYIKWPSLYKLLQ